MATHHNAIDELKSQFLELKPKLGKGWMKRYADMFCMGQLPSEIITTYQYLLNINRKGPKFSAPSPSVLLNLKLLIEE